MSFYTDAAALALEQLREYGRAVPLQRIGKTFDPVEGGTSDNGALETEATVVSVPLGKADKERLDNRLVEALTEGRLRKLIIAASGLVFEPMPNDVFIFDGAYWHVRGSTPLNPAGTPILHYAIVERGNLAPADQAALPVIALEEAVSDMSTLVNQTLPDEF